MAKMGKNVTLRAVNNLREPNFNISVNLPDTHSSFLIDMLIEAANIEPGFNRFVVRYHAVEEGYFLLAINGTYATYEEDQTYWCILSDNDRPIGHGVSIYQPHDGETVTFKLTRSEGRHADPCD